MTRCPKCDAELEIQEADPDVGIMSAGAYCDACDLAVEVEHEYHDDDVMILGTGGGRARCPKCLSTNLEMGYGLAGGGIGPYSFCPQCGVVADKSQDSI